jgi:hypothetical protein
MIEKNNNVLNDTTIKRVVNYNENDKQITFLDQRFYGRNEKHYPSVTYILSFIPKNKIFLDWLREKGEDSDNIAKMAADKGKQVHKAIEKLLRGEEVNWIQGNGEAAYSLEVWQMILRFQEFWQMYKPELVGSEIHVFSDRYEYAGTIDLLIKIGDELWLIDIKTNNQIAPIYNYQIAAYKQAFDECFDKKIDRRGILWLKAHTRGEDKSGKKMQGKNWQLIEPNKEFDEDFQSFLLFYAVFKHECDYFEPITNIYPTSIKL